MFRAKVYKIMIGAPSDINDEVNIAKEVLQEWNYINSERNKIVLLPLHWSISSYPSSGNHPQKILNKQLTDKSDALICVFGKRLGTPTDTDISGTVEEIHEHLKGGKEVMIFFRKNIEISSFMDIEQVNLVLKFKESIGRNDLFVEYENNTFKKVFSDKLQLFLNNTWLNPDYKSMEIKEDVTIILDKAELVIPYNAKGYISVNGIGLDKCNIKIEDEYYARASISNGNVEIEGRKVGETKLIVSYGDSNAECLLKITTMNSFCGSPILQFGMSYSKIKDMCHSVYKEDERGFTCKEGNILHHYIFENEKLVLIISCVNQREGYSSFLEVHNSMNERYTRLSNSNNIYWYQQSIEQFYIASVEDKQHKTWIFFYSDSKDLINENIDKLK